jgi:NADH-quinone oxidoreductase subunit D
LTTYLGRLVGALGQKTLFQYIFVLREGVLTVQEELTGGRILPQAFKIGACRRELPLGNIQKIKAFLDSWSKQYQDWSALLKDDRLLRARLQGLLSIDPQLIEKLAWWGIVGKAGGVPYDARIHRPHGAYGFVSFRVPTRKESDGLARFEVAMAEVELTLNLINSLLKDFPNEGSVNPEPVELKPGLYNGWAESAKGPVISAVEVSDKGAVSALRLFSVGQRVWPICDHLFSGIRAEDFDVAFASLGVDTEDAET